MEGDNRRTVQGKACLCAIFDYEADLASPGCHEMMSSFHDVSGQQIRDGTTAELLS